MLGNETFRAAVVQAGAVPFDSIATSEKAARLIDEAASGGARLIVFPEAFIGGYPKGADFGTVVGQRSAEGREAFRAYHAASVSVDGPEVAEIRQAAERHGVVVVIGIIERTRATLYCTALIIDGSRGTLAKHRKLMPTAAERLIWGFGDGSTLPVVETGIGNVGAVICWENYMPALRLAMYGKGVTLYCAPTADDRDSWLPSMRHIGMEGRCFVFSACQHIRRSAYPADYECASGDDGDVVLMRGGSAIIGPLGEVLAGPVFDEDAILFADIDTDDVVRARYDFDVTGHYARPDIFTLKVDERPRLAIETCNGA
ncbi:carbon-nitrogen hydrolase family protein [Flavisphingomonas formosensis]|uniref:carbon-nitrogen hydrolase family protein n=1 Tax=Flavisphingomonas formosensis TaxID=861534 RepID=UPI0012F8750F|nr:carbon-nitrogen hydrolase family protein [Sphingomonas formosensis]